MQEFYLTLKGEANNKVDSLTWPTKVNPTDYYFKGLWFQMHQEKVVIERKTYSILEWLGDVGGLFDGLRLIFGQLVGPVAMFALKASLWTEVFSTGK